MTSMEKLDIDKTFANHRFCRQCLLRSANPQATDISIKDKSIIEKQKHEQLDSSASLNYHEDLITPYKFSQNLVREIVFCPKNSELFVWIKRTKKNSKFIWFNWLKRDLSKKLTHKVLHTGQMMSKGSVEPKQFPLKIVFQKVDDFTPKISAKATESKIWLAKTIPILGSTAWKRQSKKRGISKQLGFQQSLSLGCRFENHTE